MSAPTLPFRRRVLAMRSSRIQEKLLIDNFAGGGGASLGIEMALGRAVDLSINHDPSAVEMHTINHPASRHACENVWKVDPKKITRGRPVGLAWFSPDCRHFSRAKGGKPVSPRVRGLAWIVVKWAKLVAPEIIVLENVREFEDWGPLVHVKGAQGEGLFDKDGRPVMLPDRDRKGMTFRRWVSMLRKQGYVVEWRVLNAADYGAPTHRRRLFLIARRDGNPIAWPKPTHGPGRRKPYRSAAECIDFSDLGRSIFDRKKPLAEKTLRRIVKGLERYVLNNPRPFILQVQNGSSDNGVRDSADPLNTITARPKGGGMALVSPVLIEVNHGGNDPRYKDLHKPLPATTGKLGIGIACPYLIQRNGERDGQLPRSQQIDKPINTVTPSNTTGTLIAPWMTCYYGSDKEIGSEIGDPIRTVTTRDRVALVAALLRRFGVDSGDVPTVTINGDRYVIADIFMRMLHPRELARAQGFPDDYMLTGSKANQVAKIGNSVCPPVAAAIVKANCRHLKAGAA